MSLQSLDHGSSSRRDACVFSPDQVICALLGRQEITVRGFGGELSPELSMTIPNVSLPDFLELDAQEKAIAIIAKKRMVKQRIWAGAAVVCAILLGLIVGMITGKFSVHPSEKSKQIVRWHTVAVRSAGVEILIGKEHLVIPIGGIFPSGETLQSTDVARQVYSTPNQVVNVKQQGTYR